ncbi:MAG: methyltransferase domain-containing protein [Deltaproteobacteria bacterium]|nr:methyltransferase domain-containing protein [Deltaproteobacteria bacterium]
MKLNQSKIDKLQSFFSKIAEETYPEPISEPHLSITEQMVDYFNDKYFLPSNSKILDVGCGQGLALELFTEKDFNPTSITLNSEDCSVCRRKGYQAYQMDQSFLDFRDQEFDFVDPDTYWAFIQQKA